MNAKNSEFEVVIHIRSSDGEAHQSMYFPLVEELKISRDGNFPDEISFDDLMLNRVPVQLGSNHTFEFTTRKNTDGIEYIQYDNKIAAPNLDHFLATFTKAERLRMVKDYVNEMEERLGAFVREFGAQEIRDYLDVCHPLKDVVTEEDCDNMDDDIDNQDDCPCCR